MKLPFPKGILLDMDDTIIAFDTLTEVCWERTAYEFSETVRNFGISD